MIKIIFFSSPKQRELNKIRYYRQFLIVDFIVFALIDTIFFNYVFEDYINGIDSVEKNLAGYRESRLKIFLAMRISTAIIQVYSIFSIYSLEKEIEEEMQSQNSDQLMTRRQK